MSNVNCRRRRPGFSLIEVLLFMLMALAMATILINSLSGFSKTRAVNLEATASQIANREIENLKNTTFPSLPGSGSISDPDLTKLSPDATATRTVVNYQGDTDIKQITITVSWTEEGVAKQIEMVTLLYEYGV